MMEVIQRHPQTLLAYTENPPDPESDEFYRTIATYAVGEMEGRWLEIALRQDLSHEWTAKCEKYNLHVPCCYVFHARYLN